MRVAAADRKPVEPVIGFSPPAVEHREVQPSIEHDLLSARAARLQWPSRIVQPHVDTLDEVAADVDVVVLDEDDLPGEPWVARKPGDLLKYGSPGSIQRMGLAGEDQLHGT